MQIDLESMKGKSNYKVYSYMWSDDSRIPGEICKTYYPKNKQDSDNSYSFEISDLSEKYNKKTSSVYLKTAKKLSKEDKEFIAVQLISNFKIKEKDIFLDKFKEVCSGSGGEGAKITTLHSSSLCALLFFYKVSDIHPFKYKIDGKNVEFNKVLFEYQNEVIEGRKPSNVDVVLTGKDCDGKDIILFLESKFSEYLAGGQANIALEYVNKHKEIYSDPENNTKKKTFLDEIGFEFKKNKNEESFKHQIKIYNENKKVYKIGPTEGSVYSEGIKQMISHFIGLENYLKKPYDKRSLPGNAEIYLGEILFDFSFSKAEKHLNNYFCYYNKLAEELSKLNNIHVLKKPLKYSLFKEQEYINYINPTIRKFYFGEEKQV